MGGIITLEENVKLIYESAANEILNYTPQLYIKRNKNSTSIKPFGSSVLFSNGGNNYLITAAHCIKQSKQIIKIGVMISGNFYFIKGFVCMMPGPDKNIDLAVVKLEDDIVIILKKAYRFLNKTHVVFNANIMDESDYLIVGFPNSKTTIDYAKKKIKSEPLVYIAKEKSNDGYTKMKIKKHTNTLLRFNRRKSSFILEGEMNMSPVPDGISGCGLWYIPSYFTTNPTFKLSGIMIEHYDKENMVLATKIEVAMQMISLITKN